jgi:DNA-binding transcriptional ArsR family regulator
MPKPRVGPRTPAQPEGGLPAGAIHAGDVRRARELLSEVDHEGLAAVFDALSEPTRLRIVHVLLQQEMCTNDLAAALRLSEPAVSQHLRILRNLGIASSRRAGRIVYYSVASRPMGRLFSLGLRVEGQGVDRARLDRLGRPAQPTLIA